MDDVLKRYPRFVAGGFEVRLLGTSDDAALVEFFRRIPVEERQLFREDVTQPSVIRGWLRNLDYARVLTIVAVRGSRIVAEATLHRDVGGWARHLGKVRVTLEPEVRRQGLSRILLQEFIDLAKPLGLAILEGEILDVQKRAALLFEEMGFQCVATLPQHAIDLVGRLHDVRLYAQAIHLPEGLAPEAKLKEADADIGGG